MRVQRMVENEGNHVFLGSQPGGQRDKIRQQSCFLGNFGEFSNEVFFYRASDMCEEPSFPFVRRFLYQLPHFYLPETAWTVVAGLFVPFPINHFEPDWLPNYDRVLHSIVFAIEGGARAHAQLGRLPQRETVFFNVHNEIIIICLINFWPCLMYL